MVVRPDEDWVKRVLERYENPVAAYSYGSPGTIKRYAKQKFGNARVKESDFKYALEHAPAYVYHREFHDTRFTNPIYVYARRAHVELDLADMSGLSKHNDGVRFLLTAIDAHTRYAWVIGE